MTTEIAVSDPLEAVVLPLVLDSVPSPVTRLSYAHSIRDFLAFCRGGGLSLCKATVHAYRASLEAQGFAPSTINTRLAAVRKLAVEAQDNGLLDPVIGMGIARVAGVRSGGVRAGNWLGLKEAQSLLSAPDCRTLKGIRDRAILAVLLGCGLRRQELATLEVSHLAQRDGRAVLVDLLGKGRKLRTVPVPAWAHQAITAWLSAAGITEGRMFRSITNGRMSATLSAQSVMVIVQEYSTQVGVRVAPHDLRRTFAKLAHKSGGMLEQIQLSLGHASIQTTERYLGIRQDLVNAPADLIALTV